MLDDSGKRVEFETGAVREDPTGKGRCDLFPLKSLGYLLGSDFLVHMGFAWEDRKPEYFERAFYDLVAESDKDVYELMLEVGVHFEEGAAKYSPNNWRKGIPAYRFVDSAVRHYFKWCAGWEDEPHLRAAFWNVICGYWTVTELGYGDDDEVGG